MNTAEFRLLAIWQSVVEMKNVQQKMPAYQKIASQVGIDERNVRENIKKLVEQGFLVEKESWFATNFEHEFIQFVVKTYEEVQREEPTIRFQIVGEPTVPTYEKTEKEVVPHPSHYVDYSGKTVQMFKNAFGDNYYDALRFYKSEILKTI